MGAALHALVDSIENDLILNTPTAYGDFCPIVFILTSGPPTDNYHTALQRLKRLYGSRKPTIVVLYSGSQSQADMIMLREITENVFSLFEVTPDIIKRFMRWNEGDIISA